MRCPLYGQRYPPIRTLCSPPPGTSAVAGPEPPALFLGQPTPCSLGRVGIKGVIEASAAVRLAFRPRVLALAVEDDEPPAAADGQSAAGHAIIGMPERAAAVGGWLTAGPRDGGGFQVLAELPAPAPAGAAP